MSNSPTGGRTTTTANGVASIAPSANGGIVPELLNSKQTAQLCGIGARTLWRWSRSGIAPAPVKIGGTAVRYRRDQYQAWIADGCPRVDEMRAQR